jgi:threonine dehydrogenase-like Zn-dependent dehydrogenase
MHSPGVVRVEEREDPKIIEPTDAIIRLAATCICGSDLWPYRGIEAADHLLMGHEYVGVVEEVGSAVQNVKNGDFVVGSFVISDNTCEICQAGYQSRCVHGQFVAQRRRSAHRPSGRASRWLMARWSPPMECRTRIWSSRSWRHRTCSAPAGSPRWPPTQVRGRPSLSLAMARSV